MVYDLLIGVLASIIAAYLLGEGIYKYKLNKNTENLTTTQKRGSNQISLQNSKYNNINIGDSDSKNEKRNKSK